MKISEYRINEIVEEVFDFLFNDQIDQFEFKLQVLMGNRSAYETEELALYLRASVTSADKLPTWQILLNAAIEQAYIRSENVSDIFYGMAVPRVVSMRHTMKR